MIVPSSSVGKVTLPSGLTTIGPSPSGLTTGLSILSGAGNLPSFPGNSTPPSGLGLTIPPSGVSTVPSGDTVLPPGI